MKCAAYIRTGSKNHVDQNLRKQSEMIKDFTLENNWELECIYTDVGSGVNKNKNLSLMIEDAHQGKFDIIVVTEPSRLLRSSELSSEIKSLRKSNKVHIVTMDNRINTIHNDEKLLSIYSLFYEQEAKVRSQRIKDRKMLSKKNKIK